MLVGSSASMRWMRKWSTLKHPWLLLLDLNNAVEILPSKWFAQKLGIKSELPYFEITDEKERQSVSASAYFS